MTLPLTSDKMHEGNDYFLFLLLHFSALGTKCFKLPLTRIWNLTVNFHLVFRSNIDNFVSILGQLPLEKSLRSCKFCNRF